MNSSNELDGRRPDISRTIDTILDGKKWSPKDLDNNYVYYNLGSRLARMDTKSKELAFVDEKTLEPIGEPARGYTF